MQNRHLRLLMQNLFILINNAVIQMGDAHYV